MKLKRYLRVNLLGPGPRLIKKEFTGPRSRKGWETLVYRTTRRHILEDIFLLRALQSMMNLGLFYASSSFSTVRASNGVGPSTPRPTTNLEGLGIPFCLDHHLWPVRHGRLYQQLRYRRHSSQDHTTTQAPQLRQSRDTYGRRIYTPIWILKFNVCNLHCYRFLLPENFYTYPQGSSE
jgi:hypothetical protein